MHLQPNYQSMGAAVSVPANALDASKEDEMTVKKKLGSMRELADVGLRALEGSSRQFFGPPVRNEDERTRQEGTSNRAIMCRLIQREQHMQLSNTSKEHTTG